MPAAGRIWSVCEREHAPPLPCDSYLSEPDDAASPQGDRCDEKRLAYSDLLTILQVPSV